MFFDANMGIVVVVNTEMSGSHIQKSLCDTEIIAQWRKRKERNRKREGDGKDKGHFWCKGSVGQEDTKTSSKAGCLLILTMIKSRISTPPF